MAAVNQQYPDARLQQTALGIAYDIVNQQTELGDTSGLKLLSKFIPNDSLLAADAGRFINQHLKVAPVKPRAIYLDIRKDMVWLSMLTYHDQLLGIGLKGDELLLLRANWQGKVSYQYLTNKCSTTSLWLLADQDLSDHVWIAGEQIPQNIDQKLEAYSYFEREFGLKTLDWLPRQALTYCLNGNKGITVLQHAQGLTFSDFSITGQLIASHPCNTPTSESLDQRGLNFSNRGMVWRNNHFYLFTGQVLLRYAPGGPLEELDVASPILQMDVTGQHTALKIALRTEAGCLIVTPSLKGMNISSTLFATGMHSTNIKLLGNNRLAVAEGNRAEIFNITHQTPESEHSITTEYPIKGILAIPKRNHCAFLEINNRVSVYDMGE